MAKILERTDVAREEALRMSADRRIADPADLDPNRQPVLDWEQWYQRLWKLKIDRFSQDDR